MGPFRPLFCFTLLVFVYNSGFSQTAQWDTTSLPLSYQYKLSIDAQGQIYCMGDTVLYKSTDDGLTWTSQGVFSGSAQTISVLETGTVFLGNFALGVFRSTDDGVHWSDNLVTEGCNGLAVHPQGHVFAGLTYIGNGHVHRSTDGGDTWTGVPLPNASNSFATECFAFGDSNEIYAGTIDGFYRSTDFGVSWTQFNSGLLGKNIRVMVVTPDQTVFIQTTYSSSFDGVYRSTDRGQSWQRIDGNDPYFNSLVASQNGDLLGVSDDGVFRSPDDGATWVNIGTELGTFAQFHSIVVTPSGRILVGGSYVYRKRELLTHAEELITHPSGFSLQQNYPNPFNPLTIINYQLAINNFVSLRVYDVLGNEVATLVNERKPAGEYSVTWDGDGLPSGVYLYQLQSGNFVQTKKMLLLR